MPKDQEIIFFKLSNGRSYIGRFIENHILIHEDVADSGPAFFPFSDVLEWRRATLDEAKGLFTISDKRDDYL